MESPPGGAPGFQHQGTLEQTFMPVVSQKKKSLTPREREICEIIGPTLKERGLIFVGIDVIGDYLTEINVTSPTGIQEINALDDIQIEKLIWDAIEDHHSNQRNKKSK